jgi:hypothetical protein
MHQVLLAVARAAAAAAMPAFAGGACEGFGCSNRCPLAQQANTRRSNGREALTIAPTVRATLAAAVQKNLARI